MAGRVPLTRWKARALGLAVAVATLVLMVATEPRMAIIWDEGYTLGREARIRAWVQALRDPAGFAAHWQPPREELVQQDRVPPPAPADLDTRARLLDAKVLAWFWPFAREEPHGHPPFYAIVGMLGDVVAPAWQPLPRARLGTMLAFSLTAGAVFSFVAQRWSVWPALAATGAWVLQPRLFAEGHYATYDAILSSLWVASILAFASAVGDPGDSSRRYPRWGWVVTFGILAGWAADTKLTGWFLPLPFAVWAALYRDRRAVLTLIVAGLIGAVTLYIFNPCWWDAPVWGVERFLRSNLTRAETRPIPVLFLGRVIETPTESLPWYNTLVWTALVTPVGFLALALLGCYAVGRRPRAQPVGVLVLIHWLFVLLLRALPHTPGHDGVRQFLPAFGCLALLSAFGAGWLEQFSGRLGKALIVIALMEGAASVAIMMPVPLSYYSPLVCGLPGASAVGMEPTYYWDGLTDEALDWINANTGPGEKVLFSTNPTSWLYLRRTGKLRPATMPGEPGEWRWYVVQNRPGAWTSLDRALVSSGKASYVSRKLGVPLVWVFPFSEVEAWSRAQRTQGAGR